MICLYAKGVSHVVEGVHCKIVSVPTVDDMNALLATGEYFHTVDEVYAEKVVEEEKPKKGRKTKPVEEVADVVESAESDEVAGADEDENPAD